MIDLPDLRLFATLLSARSLAAAARALDVTPPALTVRLQRIERKLGTQLVIRGARQLSLTDAGRDLANEASALLQQIGSLAERVGQAAQEYAGPLRIAAPFGFGRRHVAPLVQSFVEKHAQVAATLVLAENPLREHAEADVVVHIGRLRDSSLIGHKLGSNERWVCASPQYLGRRGIPQSPRDLSNHCCLALQENDEDTTLWSLRRGRRGAPTSVRVRPLLVSNDGEVLCQWAERGLGVILRSQWDVAPRIAAGKLVRLLPGWLGEEADVYALVHGKQGLARRAGGFIEHMRTELKLDA